MSGEAQLNLFVSSPGDVQRERERVDFIVERLNAEYAGRVKIRSIRWETRYYSSHDTFQAQIPEARDCDLVLAVFGARLGSPLPEMFPRMPSGEPYPSGTAYEVLSAMEARRQGHGVPDIYVFRRPAAPLVSLDAADRADIEGQWKRLTGFFENWFRNSSGQFLAAFQEFGTTDEFATKVEDCLRQWLERRGFPAKSAMWDRARLGSPYPGLAAFDETRKTVFFGREIAIDQAIQRLRDVETPTTEGARAPFLLLIGASGSGKSSLLRAGLLPRVGMPGVLPEVDLWRSAVVVLGNDPFASLAAALLAPNTLGPELSRGAFRAPQMLAKQLAADPDVALAPLRDALEAAAATRQRQGNFETPRPARLFLAFDQAERLLIETPAEMRLPFAALLEALCRQRLASVVIALRSDAYARFQSLAPFTRLREAGATLDLLPATASELEVMATRPAALCDPPLLFEKRDGRALSSVLVEDARGGDALPLLQMTLARLSAAEAARGDGVLRYADYQGLAEAVSQTANEALAGLGAASREQLPHLITGLVRDIAADPLTGEPTPIIGVLDRVRFEAGRPTRTALVEAFVAKRLLTSEGDGAGQRVRPTHESLLRIWPEAVRVIAEATHLIRAREALAPIARDWFEATEADKARHLDISPALLDASRLYVERFGDEVPAATRAFVAEAGAAAEAKRDRERLEQERRLADAQAIAQANRRIARRTGVGLVAALALAAAAGWQWWSATEARQVAQIQRDRAERALSAATKTADTLIFDLARKLRDQVGVPKAVVKDVLDTAVDLQDQLAKSGESSAQLSAGHAAALHELALARLALGDAPAALGFAQQAREAYLALVSADAANAGAALALVRTQIAIAIIFHSEGQNDAALKAAQEARATIDAAIDRGLNGRPMLTERGHVLVILSNVARLRKDLESQLKLAREGLDALNALGDPAPAETDLREDLALAQLALGDALLASHDLDGAAAAFVRSAAASESVVKDDPSNTRFLRENSMSLERLGETLTDKHDLKGALKAFSAGEEIAIGMAARDPENLQWQFDIAIGHREVGDTRLALGDAEGAAQSYRQALEIDERLNAKAPTNDLWNGHRWQMLKSLGEALTQGGRDPEGAIAKYREARAWADTKLAGGGIHDTWIARIGQSDTVLGRALLAKGDVDGAIEFFRHGVPIYQELLASQPNNALWPDSYWLVQTELGDALTRRGKDAKAALDAYREALAFSRSRLAREVSSDGWLQSFLASTRKVGGALQASGDASGAIDVFRAGLEGARGRGADPKASYALKQEMFAVATRLAGALEAQPDAAGARAIYGEAEKIIRDAIALSPKAADAKAQLSVLLTSVARLDMADAAYDKAMSRLRESIGIAEAAVAEQPGEPLWVQELAIAHNSLAEALNATGDWRGAVAEYRLKLEIEKKLPESEASTSARRLSDAATQEALGALLIAHDDPAAALEAMSEALRLRKSLAADAPADPTTRLATLIDANTVGGLLNALGNLKGALALFTENAELARSLAARADAEPRAADDLAIALTKLAETQLALSQNAAALKSFASAAEGLGVAAAARPGDEPLRARFAAALRRLAEARLNAGDADGALRALKEARAAVEPLASAAAAKAEIHRELGRVDNAIGALLGKQKDWAGAGQAYAASANVIEAWLKSHPTDFAFLDDLAFTQTALGDALTNGGDPEAAKASFRASIGAAEAMLALQPGNLRGQRFIVVSGDRLGNLFMRGGDLEGALSFFLKSREQAAAIAARTPAEPSARASLKLAVDKIGFVANAQLIKDNYTAALATLDLATPRAPEQNWLDLIRAEALMLLERPDEARPFFLAHRGEMSFGGKTWEALILESFGVYRTKGVARPLMDEIERVFATH